MPGCGHGHVENRSMPSRPGCNPRAQSPIASRTNKVPSAANFGGPFYHRLDVAFQLPLVRTTSSSSDNRPPAQIDIKRTRFEREFLNFNENQNLRRKHNAWCVVRQVFLNDTGRF